MKRLPAQSVELGRGGIVIMRDGISYYRGSFFDNCRFFFGCFVIMKKIDWEALLVDIDWVDGFEIRVKVDHGSVVISANKEGMLSLAKQLTALAEAVPGQHIHYDEYNSLEEGSTEMIIARVE